jgi:NCAIR mutase (PurE)-related protein
MFYSIGLPFYIFRQNNKPKGWIKLMEMKKAAIIMGSDSDLPVVEKAFSVFEEFGVPYEVHVYSAHRTPAEAREFVTGARANGFGVIIAAAGIKFLCDGCFHFCRNGVNAILA